MEELYWITRFDAIHGVSIAFAIVSGIVTVVSSLFLLDDDPCEKTTKRVFGVSFPLCVLFILTSVFIPTTKEALIIYGIGGTLDYVKSNDTAKKIPEKAIVALDRYLDSLNEEKQKEE